MKKFLLLAVLIIESVPMCLRIEADEEDRQMPAMLQVCSDKLWEQEKEIGAEPWWIALVVEIKDKYPGYCLAALKVFPVVDGLAIVYSVKSPDGSAIINDSLTYSDLLTANQ